MEEREKERERARERKIAREGESGGDEGRRNSQKARAMRGLGIMSRGVDSAWNRKDSRSRWRRGEVDCMLRLWRGKVGSRRGWAREWKENGRMYSLSRDYNRGGCFLRLGVVDLEGKRFSVYIPRGKGEKGGWASMADTLRSLGCEESCPKNQKAVVSRTKPNMVKSFVEATKVAKEKERAAARVDITTEEVGRNLSKLGHCIVGTWNHNAAKGDDLRGWGSQLTRIWRLKGSLGLAKMERGKVLLEFEIPAEAEQVSKMGSFSWGGRSPFREVESGDGMFEGRGKEQRSVGAGSWAACLHVGSGYSEENWGRVWGLPCD
ncbi:hypothetical protein CK203_113493 [Vitis vinifera]|uniref:DUF4283 domain-containing protein n=1 Tax=Vitis vinifera TaxID=29760 RepID=A0A438FGZ3_VITVI|nr:hypothetical protein CK203_113493 [Vitis vinifera]